VISEEINLQATKVKSSHQSISSKRPELVSRPRPKPAAVKQPKKPLNITRNKPSQLISSQKNSKSPKEQRKKLFTRKEEPAKKTTKLPAAQSQEGLIFNGEPEKAYSNLVS